MNVEADGQPPFFAKSYGRNDFEDEREVRERWWRPGPGEAVLDVGAAIGSYTLPALARGASVIALCPQRDHARMLGENLDRNPGFAERCLMLDYGLYDREGWLHLEGSAYAFTEEEPPPHHENIQVRPLDAFTDVFMRIDWIKLDVEGAEEPALRGGERTLRRLRPRILVENHLFMDPLIEARVKDFVLGLGVGYACDSRAYSHGTVSHSFFEVPDRSGR